MMKDSIRDLLLSSFLYHTSLLLGWLLASFIFIYSPMNLEVINRALRHHMLIQPFWIASGFLFLVLYLMLRKYRVLPLFTDTLSRLIIWQAIFLSLLLVNYLLYQYTWHIHVLELVVFLATVFLLLRWATILSAVRQPGWHHPTTFGSVLVSTMLNGCTLLIILTPQSEQANMLPAIIIILLLFELLIVYARFRFLSRYSQITNQLARLLMGRFLFLFGTQLMIGIFMPLVFIGYFYFIKGETIEGAAVLILIGTFLERYLFQKTSGFDLHV